MKKPKFSSAIAITLFATVLSTSLGITALASTPDTDYTAVSYANTYCLNNIQNVENGTLTAQAIQKYQDFISSNSGSAFADDAQFMIAALSRYLNNAPTTEADLQKVADNYHNQHLDIRTVNTLNAVYGVQTYTDKSLTEIPDDALAEYLIGKMYCDVNNWSGIVDYSKANTDLSKVISSYPGSGLASSAEYQIGQNDEMADDTNGALTAYQSVISNYPNDKMAVYLSYNRLGSICSQIGNTTLMDSLATKFASDYSSSDYFTESSFQNGNDSKFPVHSFNLKVKIDNTTMSDTQKASVLNALNEWTTASNNKLQFTVDYGATPSSLTSDGTGSDIYIKGTAENGSVGGQTYSAAVQGVTVQSSIVVQTGLSDNVFYHAVLHEIGHALGIEHSFNRNDVMYFGGDYTGTGHLTQRDTATLLKYCDLISTNTRNIYSAVEKAGNTYAQSDVDSAKNLVDSSVLVSFEKTRLDGILSAIATNIPQLDTLRSAVTKAQQTKLQSDIDSAYALEQYLPYEKTIQYTTLLKAITPVSSSDSSSSNSSGSDTSTPTDNSSSSGNTDNNSSSAASSSSAAGNSSSSGISSSNSSSSSSSVFAVETASNSTSGNSSSSETASTMTVNIVGQMLDKDGKPIANATVQLHSTLRTATTDSNGYYKFENVELGKHTLIVEDSSGNALATKSIEIVQGNATGINGDVITVADNATEISITAKIDGNGMSIEKVVTSSVAANPKTGETQSPIPMLIASAISLAAVALLRLKMVFTK